MSFVLAAKGESHIDPSNAGGMPADRVALTLGPDIAGLRPQNDKLTVAGRSLNAT